MDEKVHQRKMPTLQALVPGRRRHPHPRLNFQNGLTAAPQVLCLVNSIAAHHLQISELPANI